MLRNRECVWFISHFRKKGVVVQQMNLGCGRLGALICLQNVDIWIYIYIYSQYPISNSLNPIWKCTHKGLPRPKPTPSRGRPQGGGAWGGVGGIPYGYSFILDMRYWISIHMKHFTICINIYIYIHCLLIAYWVPIDCLLIAHTYTVPYGRYVAVP